MPARQDYPPNRYPLSDELCLFMDNHPEFRNALKLSNTNRFLYIPFIFTSHPPINHPLTNDQVIGMWYIDIYNVNANRNPIFKQDFIVNVESTHTEFITYTTRPVVRHANSLYVRLIQDFYREYGANGQYYHNGNRWAHHYNTVNDLPDEPRLRSMARQLLGSI